MPGRKEEMYWIWENIYATIQSNKLLMEACKFVKNIENCHSKRKTKECLQNSSISQSRAISNIHRVNTLVPISVSEFAEVTICIQPNSKLKPIIGSYVCSSHRIHPLRNRLIR